jgi:hypothetical protein
MVEELGCHRRVVRRTPAQRVFRTTSLALRSDFNSQAADPHLVLASALPEVALSLSAFALALCSQPLTVRRFR